MRGEGGGSCCAEHVADLCPCLWIPVLSGSACFGGDPRYRSSLFRSGTSGRIGTSSIPLPSVSHGRDGLARISDASARLPIAKPMFVVQILPGWSRVDPMLCWNTSYSFAFCCLRDRRPIAGQPIPARPSRTARRSEALGGFGWNKCISIAACSPTDRWPMAFS